MTPAPRHMPEAVRSATCGEAVRRKGSEHTRRHFGRPPTAALGHGRLQRVRHGRSALSCGHGVAAQRIGEECHKRKCYAPITFFVTSHASVILET